MKPLSAKQIAVIAAVSLLLIASAFFLSNVVLPAGAGIVSGINVVLLALPAFWATSRWLGRRDALILFAIVGAFALFVETVGLITAFPYGRFTYSDLLGYKLLGLTPWTVVLAWTPLVLAAYAIARRTIPNRLLRIVVTVLLLVEFDLVLDPGAVRVGFWRYLGGGPYYGVPISNFLGWLLSGTIAAVIVDLFIESRRPLLPVPAQIVSSTFFIMVFWTAIAFFSGLYWALAIGIAVLVFLAVFYFKYHYAFDDMIVYCDEEGRPTGTERKLAAHNGETRRHSAFSVFLFNDKGQLLLQQRALNKKTWPGVWSNSCCGHVMLHESVEAAASRRLKYELGLRASELEIVLPDFRYRAEKDGVVENEICPVLVAKSSKQPLPNPSEVNDTRWIDWDEFVQVVADPANGYSPWAIEEVELLARDPRFAEIRAGFDRERQV